MTHHDIFEQIIRDIISVGEGLTAVIVSRDGMVLISSTDNEMTESHLSAFSSICMDYGHKLLTPPGQPVKQPVRMNLCVGTDHYALIVRLDEQVSVVVRGSDRTQIAALMKKGLDLVDRMNTLKNDNPPA